MASIDIDLVGSTVTPRVIQFKTFYWNYEETDDHELFIHVAGRTADDKSVHCIIEEFSPFVYLELPKRVKWNKGKCAAVFEYFKKIMKSEGPLEYWLLKKKCLYYLDPLNVMCLTFPTNKACGSLASRCRNSRTGIVISGVGTFRAGELIVHENIDPIIKFTASKSISLAGWLQVTETIAPGDEELEPEDRKFSTADIDLRCKWTDVEIYNPIDALSVVVRPLCFTFDIECYSRNHNSKLSDPDDPANVIFSISTVTGKYGAPASERIKNLLSLQNPKDIPGVNVFRYASERDLLLAFRDHLVDINPDVIPGYNTMKFDWNYIIKRAEKLGIYMKFALFSRVIGRKADLKKSSWSSSAYGEQEFRYLDPFGRTNVDVLIEVDRNYKLVKYTLDYVAEYFLDQHKEDVTARQLFMLYQFTTEMTSLFDELEDGLVPKVDRIKLKKKIQLLMPRRRCNGKLLELRASLMAATTGEQFKDLVREPLTLTGSYNVQDSVLTIDLCEKLNLWTSMEAMSNTMHVPMSYLHTRGQQIKVLAMVYRETIFNDIIIPNKPKPKEEDLEKYQGAMVIEANPGDYDNVICFDFESLYPSVMIAYNICHTTLIRDSDPIPDAECHVLEWEDHCGCPDDPQHRKKKPADVLCRSNRYRFRKVVTLPDGTRLHEGVMPKLERKLLLKRKGVKKEMAKLEAKLKMAKGLAGDDDLGYYKKMGWDIIKKGSMTEAEMQILSIGIKVLNAEQLSIKISCNSVSPDTPIPCMVDNVFIYKTIEQLAKPGSWQVDEDGNEYGEPIDNLQVWSDVGFTGVNYVYRHPKAQDETMHRVITHLGSVDVTEDHSLLDEDGNEVSCADLAIGDKLMHFQAPTPDDTPEEPLYRAISDKTIRKYIVDTTRVVHSTNDDNRNLDTGLSTALVFIWGFFFAEGTTGAYRVSLDDSTQQTAGGDKRIMDTKHSWCLYNQDIVLLKRMKALCEMCYPNYNFVIYDYMKTRAIYHMRVTTKLHNGVKLGSIVDFVNEYRKLFYDERGRKVIPDIILNNPLNIRQAFFMGYYAGDGNRHLEVGVVVSNKGSKGTAQLCYLAKSLGYIVSVNLLSASRNDNIYRLQCCTKFRNPNPTAIKNITPSPDLDKIKIITKPIIRNGANLVLKDNKCIYKNITIHCERLPRQTILNTLDAVAKLFISTKRGIITEYNTKTKRVTYCCPECKIQFTRLLPKKNIPLNNDARKSCKCKIDYIATPIEFQEPPRNPNDYVYDIETVSHHFAAGVGDLIVHNSGYGGLGAQMGFIPLVPGAASVTAKGRELIIDAIKFVLTKYNSVETGEAKLVYGDTDSAMMTFVGKTTDESFVLGDTVSKEISHYLKTKLIGVSEQFIIANPDDGIDYRIDKFPRNLLESLDDELRIKIHEYDANPINLQFENLYKRYFLLTKKRYVARATNRAGKITAKIKKGNVLARRDSCMYLKQVYELLVEAIMDNLPEYQVMYILYDQIHKLFTRQVPDANLIKYVGVKNIINYAKKIETKGSKRTGMGPEKVFIDIDKIPIDDPIGPLDPRLVYPNLPQVLLALKMIRRGDDVPPNTRLEYIFAEADRADHQGEQAEDYTFYRENKRELDVYGAPSRKGMKPDYLLYLDKQLVKPITEALTVKYKKELVPWETMEDAYNRCIETLSDLLRYRVKNIKTYERNITCYSTNTYTVGHPTVCTKCQASAGGRCIKHPLSSKIRTYKYKGQQAQIQYILDSVEKKIANPKVANEIDPEKYPELINVSRQWKSRAILDRVHTSFKVKKRMPKKPTQTGQKLPVTTAKQNNDAFLTKAIIDEHTDIEYPRGTLVTLQELITTPNENYIGKGKGKNIYTYTIMIKPLSGEALNTEPVIIKNVPRSSLTSFRVKDSKVMSDIYKYRAQYKLMIAELDVCLSSVEFIGKDDIERKRLQLEKIDEEDV